jgi:CRISPR-associated protein Csx17
MSEPGKDIDWSLTTWEGSRRAQLRRALELTLRERLEAAEGLADVARRFAELRARGAFRSPAAGADPRRAASGVRQPPPSGYDAGE